MSLRKIVSSILLLLFVGAGISLRAEDSGISWYKDLKRATEAAQKTNQPIMIDFWADWCSPCKIMDAEVYSNPAVVTAAGRKLIAVRLQFDLQSDLARKYNVESLPSLIFTDSNGTELLRHHGFLEARDLAAVLQALPSDVSEINRLDRILQEDKNDSQALEKMGQQLRAAAFFESSNGYYSKALQHSQGKQDSQQREAVLFDMAFNSLELQDGKNAAASLERLLKEFPNSSRRPDALLGLGRAYALDEKKDKARKSFDAVITQYPESEAAAKARDLQKTL